MFVWRRFLFLLLALSSGLEGAAEADTLSSPEATVLKVGLRDAPPFAFQTENGSWTGIAVELWEGIAALEELEFEYVPLSLNPLLEAVKEGEVDVAVAALSINAEREASFDFTQPFMHSGIAIATYVEPSAWWQILSQFISWPFLSAVGSLAGVVLIFGILIWFFERKKNAQFAGTSLQGVGSGFWWSAVTMTTVGYGDKAPVTLGGRLVGLVWMYFAIIIISAFTAAITSSLTVGSLRVSIQNESDLRSSRVGVLEGSAGAEFLREERVRFIEYASLQNLADALKTREVEAVVHDAPLMKFELTRLGVNEIQLLPQILEAQSYGFGLPENSPYREQINRSLLRIVQTEDWSRRITYYLGDYSNLGDYPMW